MAPALRAVAPREGDRRGCDQLGGEITCDRKPSHLHLLAQRLARHFGLSLPVAALVAGHAFRVEAPR
jgi:hypothetical protein